MQRNLTPLIGIGAVIITTVAGGLWYWLVEGFSALDAFYQSIITVSTVGFGEIDELDRSGRAFTIVLILTGVASVLYALAGFVNLIVESTIRRFTHRRRERNVGRLFDHLVVCGYGRTGAAVASLLPDDPDVVVVEVDPGRAEDAIDAGLIAIDGDCTLDKTLTDAGIERAATMIVTLPSDSEAVSTVLSARMLNPQLRIVARVNNSASSQKLQLAGADHVVSPIEMGAQRLVADAFQPSVGTFLDAALHDTSVGFSMRAIKIADAAQSVHVPQAEASTGVRIIGVMDDRGQIVDASYSAADVHPGQTLLAVGRDTELQALQKLVESPSI